MSAYSLSVCCIVSMSVFTCQNGLLFLFFCRSVCCCRVVLYTCCQLAYTRHKPSPSTPNLRVYVQFCSVCTNIRFNGFCLSSIFEILRSNKAYQIFASLPLPLRMDFPSLTLKASKNSGQFFKGPFTRYIPGECGSVAKRFFISASVYLIFHNCP